MQSGLSRIAWTHALVFAVVLPLVTSLRTPVAPIRFPRGMKARRNAPSPTSSKARRPSSSRVHSRRAQRIAIFDDDGTLWSLPAVGDGALVRHRSRERFATAIPSGARCNLSRRRCKVIASVLVAAGDGARTTLMGALQDDMSSAESRASFARGSRRPSIHASRARTASFRISPCSSSLHYLRASRLQDLRRVALQQAKWCERSSSRPTASRPSKPSAQPARRGWWCARWQARAARAHGGRGQ